MKNVADKFITKLRKEIFSMESSRANFNQFHNSATEIFFAGGRMGAGGILSKGCSGKFAEKHLLRSLFLIKLLTCSLHIIKKECFPVTYTKLLRIPFLLNTYP